MSNLLEKAIKASSQHFNNRNAEEYFSQLVTTLASLTGAEYTFVSELQENSQFAHTVAFCANGELAENFQYDLQGTPCQDLTSQGVCCFQKDIPLLYPEDQLLIDMNIQGYLGTTLRNRQGDIIGLMAALFKSPIEQGELFQNIFEAFKTRASAELERSYYEEQLAQKIHNLTETNEQLEVARQIFDNTSDGIIVTDEKNIIIYVNKALEKMTGYNSKELTGKDPRILNSGLQNSAFYKEMWQAINTKGHWQGELLNRDKSGKTYPIFTALSIFKDDQGTIKNHIAIHRDITTEKEAQTLIAYQATHDHLTGLTNRHEFNAQINHNLNHINQTKSRGAFILINLDNFREVNDALGYKAGDSILREVANRLQKTMRDEDLLARLGGDEFAIFSHIQTNDCPPKLLDRILTALTPSIKLEDDSLYEIRSSLGVSFYPDDSLNTNQLYTHSDQALQQAKSQSRGSYALFSQELREKSRRQTAVKNRLKLAIENKMLEPYFQPIVDTHTGELSHCEVLARWHDEELGQVYPDEFIAIAEKYGYMPQLGLAIADKAIQKIAQLNKQLNKPVAVAINRSPQEFLPMSQDPLINIARIHNVPTHLIGIELTESLMVKNPELAKQQLLDLRQQGFNLSIDDFGTGYSSLAYLKNFPFHNLKIDKTFITDIGSSDEAFILVKTIIDMAHNFGMKTIAEGVENTAQLDMLKRLNCDYIQGYLFSKPLPLTDLQQYLTR